MKTKFENRQTSLSRYLARKLERTLLEHKSDQPLKGAIKKDMQVLEECEPSLCEQLLLKKKWNHAQKDPARATNDQFSHAVEYW